MGEMLLISSHAVFEAYFEELARKVLQAALWKYKSSGKMNAVIQSLIDLDYRAQVASLPRAQFQFRSVDEQIKSAADRYRKTIDHNQGIKRSNLYSLFLPLGFAESDFDNVWLSAMDAFGSNRGDAAHGRAVNPRGEILIDLPAANPPMQISVLNRQDGRARARYAPWDVEDQINLLASEAYRWDLRCLALLR
ncbi:MULTISPECIES: HEPN domain-containing protein [Nocardiaceae]|uniref:HEPN domain-containing protein n=1 Tax=Nocardiaceae TaxID=85025 RepID=UPI0011403644|nr:MULTISPECIES: HEPN domain-containing protein [Rhodococcus]